MNLTTPPPVEELDPEYAETLRRNAVRGAYKAFRPRPNRRWLPFLAGVPVAAAICAIAIGLSGLGDQNRSEPLQPAARPTTVIQTPAKASKVEYVDLGPASEADRQAAARECLTHNGPHDGLSDWQKPEFANTSTVRSARWIKDPRVPGGRVLLQSFETPQAVVFVCSDTNVTWWGRAGDLDKMYEGETVVSGSSWGWGESTTPGIAVYASYDFRATAGVASVQFRIRGVDAVSSWYSVKVVDHVGYLAGTLPGSPKERPRAVLDVRAFDKSGKQIWSKTYDR
ncbi:hypothetical protein OG474_45150 [Kribbella sp. NBC_01505]|uniref:hypothetical protein n=1 Tax=Kribbella sp. NBC_01505 TaxID=2903580 RepID=UPI00386403F4